MEFEEEDLKKIALRKAQFVQTYGALDIHADIEYLLTEVSRYRRREAEDGFLDEDAKNIIAAMRHLSVRTHPYNTATCSQCEGAKKIMVAMKAEKL